MRSVVALVFLIPTLAHAGGRTVDVQTMGKPGAPWLKQGEASITVRAPLGTNIMKRSARRAANGSFETILVTVPVKTNGKGTALLYKIDSGEYEVNPKPADPYSVSGPYTGRYEKWFSLP